jgi:hypothetical protein
MGDTTEVSLSQVAPQDRVTRTDAADSLAVAPGDAKDGTARVGPRIVVPSKTLSQMREGQELAGRQHRPAGFAISVPKAPLDLAIVLSGPWWPHCQIRKVCPFHRSLALSAGLFPTRDARPSGMAHTLNTAAMTRVNSVSTCSGRQRSRRTCRRPASSSYRSSSILPSSWSRSAARSTYHCARSRTSRSGNPGSAPS